MSVMGPRIAFMTKSLRNQPTIEPATRARAERKRRLRSSMKCSASVIRPWRVLPRLVEATGLGLRLGFGRRVDRSRRHGSGRHRGGGHRSLSGRRDRVLDGAIGGLVGLAVFAVLLQLIDLALEDAHGLADALRERGKLRRTEEQQD